jgi:hypothetical protein
MCATTSAYLSIRQHTSYIPGVRALPQRRDFSGAPTCVGTCIRQHTSAYVRTVGIRALRHALVRAYVSIRQHTSAYVSIRQKRQHTSANVKLRWYLASARTAACCASTYVSVRQQTSCRCKLTYANVCINTSADTYIVRRYLASARTAACCASKRTSASVCSTCIRQHTSAYVSIRQHTSAYVSVCWTCPHVF